MDHRTSRFPRRRHGSGARDSRDDEDEPRIVGTPRGRRALSHVGGRVEITGGSAEERQALKAALAVHPDEEETLPHVHGFHSYPARLHPVTARRLIDALSPVGGTVLDPFAEAARCRSKRALRVAALSAIDLSPLAVALAGLKASAPGFAWTSEIERAAERVAEHADERRKKRAGASQRLPGRGR